MFTKVVVRTESTVHIQESIDQLESRRKQQPLSFSLYCNLSDLQCRLAKAHLREKEFSKAIYAIERAITYNPYVLSHHRFRKKLIKDLQDLYRRRLQKQPFYRSYLNLGWENREEEEIKKAFELLNNYERSEEAREVAENRNLAFYREVKIHLVESDSERSSHNGDLMASKIHAVLDDLFKNVGNEGWEILQAWKDHTRVFPELQKIPVPRIEKLVKKVLTRSLA